LSSLPDKLPPESGPLGVIQGGKRSPRRTRTVRRIALWTLAAVAGIAVVLAIAVDVLLHSQRFHDYVLAKVQESASQSLGVRVGLQNYALHFSGISPTADLYGLVVYGAAPFADPPLLQVEHARIGVRVVSVLQQKWYLGEAVIDHPVLQLRVDAAGNTNLPRTQQKSSNGVQPLVDLGIRHAVLNGGHIYYNDRQSALDADLHNLTMLAAFDPAHNVYSGQIAYADGHLKSGVYQPIPHALNAQFEMTPSHLDVRQAQLRSGNSVINLSATLDDFNHPHVASVYHASVDASELRRLVANPQLPLGMLVLDGQASYAANPNQPALNGLNLEGTLRSERLDFGFPNGRQTIHTQARAIRASYTLSNGDAELRSFAASLLSGTMEGHASVRNLAGAQTGVAQLKLNSISLGDLQRLANTQLSKPNTVNLTLGGTLDATSSATWRGSPLNMVATADATVNASASSGQAQTAVPINGELHASYRNREQQLTLAQSYLRTPQTTLTLDGTTGKRSQMNLALNAQNLHELETIAASFSPPTQPFGLFGSASFTGRLSGPTAAPQLAGQLNAANLRVRGTAWHLLRAQLQAGPNAVSIEGGQLEPESAKGAPQGNIIFSGNARLHGWSFDRNSAFQATLNAQRLDAGELAKLSGSTTPVSGTLNASLAVHGTELNPIGQGRIELSRAAVADEPIQSVVVQFDGDGNQAHANLNVSLLAGTATGVVTYYPHQRGYDAELQSHNFRIDQLHAVKSGNVPVKGMLNLDASGHGTLDDPQLTGALTIPQLQSNGQKLEDIRLDANIAKHVATVTLQTHALNSQLNGHATVQLTGDYQAEGALDTQPIQLQPLLAAYAPDQAQDFSGQTELHATLRGPLRQRERIAAHVVIPELNLRYQNSIQMALTGPIHADYVDGVLSLQRSGLTGTGTDLQFQGSLPLLDRTKPVSLLLLGSVDLHLAQLFDPDVTSSGQVQFNINTYGVRTDPNVQGQVKIANANFVQADAPLAMSNGNGTLTLTSERLNITDFSASVGGGTVTARGGVVYRPSLQFDMAIAGKEIRMLYPEGVRETLSADLDLTGSPEHANLRGLVNLDQLSFAPDFDLSSLSSLSGGVEEPPSRGFANNLQLNIGLRSSQIVNVVSRTMSASGAANLRLTGTASEPVVLGRININSGDLIFQGNRYVLQSAMIDFINPSRTDPNINASVTTAIQQYNIGIRFEGPIERLRTSYSSDPALSSADIISLLAFGKTQEASAAASAGTNQTQTAEQSIASAVSGQVTSRLQKIAGISYLSVDPSLGTSQQNAGATVTIQQRVTSKIFVTFSTDITSTQQQVVQLQYQATPKVSVSGTRDQNGGFGLETKITREW
jgi:translocation and assembly module TamB